MSINRFHELKLSEYLVGKITEKASGKNHNYCYFDRPRNKYFAGSLSVVKQDDAGQPIEDHFSRRIAPNAVGMDIKIALNENTPIIKVTPQFSIYYRVFPTFAEQSEMLELQSIEQADENEKAEEDEEKEKDEFLIKFKRLLITCEPVEINLIDDVEERMHKIGLADYIGDMHNDPDVFRSKNKGKHQVPSFFNSGEYDRFIQALKEKYSEVNLPDWNISLHFKKKKVADGEYQLSVLLRNDTPDEGKNEKNYIDGYIFEAQIEVELGSNEPLFFEFDAIPEDYRYDKTLVGYGQNCAVEYNSLTKTYRTEFTPIYYQKLYVTRNKVNAGFKELSEDPIPVLEEIYRAMDSYYHNWIDQAKSDLSEIDYAMAEEKVMEGKEKFADEMRRFRRGIQLIKDDSKPLVRKSFMLMNEVFKRQDESRKKPYMSWRLFQIVYIVSIIPDIVSREYSDVENDSPMVDVLWFPTGGGKTETYLGLVLFNAFFDRLRGKKAGVTAWTRFALRLLSLQQIQRIADTLGQAELVRRETDGIKASDNEAFSVGYLVGEGNTPNSLTKYNDDRRSYYQQNPDLMQKFKIITKCPFCKQSSIYMDILYEEARIVHRCTNPECKEDVLPIFVVDNEIYRYLPTMIIGTVDKLSAVGNQRKFAHLFGKVTHKCPQHGYLSVGECTEKYGCKLRKTDFKPVVLKDPSPSLQIQDELHLLKEGLGTFNSHYETFIDYIQQEAQNGARQKIIAATATIENYNNQIKHMYRRTARRFPESGPILGESLYAMTLKDEVHRIFVGVMSHNKTHINTMIELLQMFHKEIQTLKSDLRLVNGINGLQDLTEGDINKLLLLYEVSLTYLLTKREGDRLDQSIEGQVTSYLHRYKLKALHNKSLTGSTNFDEVAGILNLLENPPEDEESRITSVTATSMISHGVDVARFNFMIFFGMPTQTAEYIQSSSRVGRSHVGIVLVCFNPNRERDQSHYHFFKKYHEYQDRLVEPVPINRWSKFSIKKTLPGLFTAVLLNIYYYDHQKNLYFAEEARKLIEDGKLTEEKVIDHLNRSYGIGDPGSEDFKFEIEQMVRKFFNQLRNPKQNFTSDSINPKPMRSLRDIDEPVDFKIGRETDSLFRTIEREGRRNG
ncbi:helicase-related protein [Paenibacillus sp. SAF-054]|uniref:helicase-related protein n=1 Tax=Paenibacillus sp. SAF-054 TaxID=3436863 RepID=UPI003F7E5A27